MFLNFESISLKNQTPDPNRPLICVHILNLLKKIDLRGFMIKYIGLMDVLITLKVDWLGIQGVADLLLDGIRSGLIVRVLELRLGISLVCFLGSLFWFSSRWSFFFNAWSFSMWFKIPL